MIPVQQAQKICLRHAKPLDVETVALHDAHKRTLARDVRAGRAQPPFASSAMDGYAVRFVDLAPGVALHIIGEAPAGHAFASVVQPGQAVRIFTGAPIPRGADCVIIQENVTRNGDTITPDHISNDMNIRPQGIDFKDDFTLKAPRVLQSADLALLAAMNIAQVPVTRKPKVALLATGDELVMPGGAPRADQIVSSNVFALKAMIEQAGGEAVILPIADDTPQALLHSYDAMRFADIRVTIGGASVGDYDLINTILPQIGVERQFYKIAMRPGKPLIAGRFHDDAVFLGLPGNPVSAVTCGYLFLLPVIRKMLGQTQVLPRVTEAELAVDIGPNGPREHYMRAHVQNGRVTPFDNQDSSLVSILASANAFLIRLVNDRSRSAGEIVKILPFE